MLDFSLPENFDANPKRLLRKACTLKAVLPSAPIPPEEEPVFEALIQMAEKTLCEYSVPTIENVTLGPQGS